jgi:hypothetical protein
MKFNLPKFHVQAEYADGHTEDVAVESISAGFAVGSVTPGYKRVVVDVVEKTDWEKYGGARVGDIWEAEGREYIVRENTIGPYIATIDLPWSAPFDDGFSEFEKLNPKLVRRRGVAGYDHFDEDGEG